MTAPDAKAAPGAHYGRRAGGVGARGWTPAIAFVTGLGALVAVGAVFALIAERKPQRRLTDPQPEAVYSTGVAVVKPPSEAVIPVSASAESTSHQSGLPAPRNQLGGSASLARAATANGANESTSAGGRSAPGGAGRSSPGGGAMVVYAAPASQRLAAVEPAAPSPPPRARAARVDPGARAERVARPDALLAEGALIPVTLETALNSDLPGPIRGIVGADVLSFDASRVLIPRGARLIGEYRAGLVRGRARLFAVWTRILTPDGVSVALQAPAMDGEGRVGIGGRRDSHFFERFGGALVLSLVDAGALAAAERASGDSDGRVVINTGRDARRAAEIALENSVNIAPTLRAPAGAPLQAFVTRDVDFSDVIAEGEE